jgi:hypothetical protein
VTSLFLPRSADCSAERLVADATSPAISCGDLEATAGFEPANRGFADPQPAQSPARMSTDEHV